MPVGIFRMVFIVNHPSEITTAKVVFYLKSASKKFGLSKKPFFAKTG
jgi:hypothetical protein